MVEILSSALQAGSFLTMLTGLDDEGNKKPFHLGHFFIAIDTEAFMGSKSFKKVAGDILRELRSSKIAPDAERIYTAGEKEYLNWLDRKDKGVPVVESVQKELSELRDNLNLPHVFPWEDYLFIFSN